MTWMVSTASTSAYHNTVLANSTPKIRRSFARSSFGHHSPAAFISVCTYSNAVLHVHLYPLSSILFTYLACTLLFIPQTYAPPLSLPPPAPIYSDHSAIQFYASSHRPIEQGFLQRILVSCFPFRALKSGCISFRTPHLLLVDIPTNVAYTTACTVRSLLLQSRYYVVTRDPPVGICSIKH